MDERESKHEDGVVTDERPQNGSGHDVNNAIGQRLRAYYDDVASEPVPDKFLSLLDALDKAESASKSSDA